jgi:hypothetical protein
MSEKKAAAPREHGRHQEDYAGTPTTQQLRIVGQRRRDAEEKLEHHLKKVQHKDDSTATALPEEPDDGRPWPLL